MKVLIHSQTSTGRYAQTEPSFSEWWFCVCLSLCQTLTPLPFLHQTWPNFCNGISALASKTLYCIIFTRGQFWPSGIVVACVCVCVCLSVCQSLACLRDNSGPIQARITKFGPKMQKTLVKVSIVLWTDRPWPSRSNLTWKSKFTPFWASSQHNPPPIHFGITKFGPEVQNTLVKIFNVLAGNWPWPSRSNMTKSNFQVFPYWKYITTI